MSTFSFNGYNLAEYFKFIKAEHEIGNDRSISTDSSPKIGVNVQEVDFGPKKIKVTVSLSTRDLADMTFVDPSQPAVVDKGLFYRVREEAARVLYTDKAVKLQLPDEPDRYYLALPKGSIDLKGIDDWYDQATIEFSVPDGVAHSLTYRTFSEPKQEGGKLTFNLDNQGSVDAQPIITVKHNSENGYIGLVNQTGVLEIGDRQESERRPSEILLDFRDKGWVDKALKLGVSNKAILNDSSNLMNYNLINNDTWGVDHLALAEEGAPGSGNKDATTHGASISWEIPVDSDKNQGAIYEYLEWVERFMIGHILQMGYIKIAVSDQNDRFLYGVETFKRGYGSDCEYNFLTADGSGGYQIFPNTFSSAEGNRDNPFNRDKGTSYISRKNDVVNFYFKGQVRSIQAPGIKDKKSKKIHVYFGEVGSAERVTFMYIERFLYRKDYGNYDSPNRYRRGSKVILDSEQDTVNVDNILKNGDVVQGSDFITIPPGKSELEMYLSPWIKKTPSVSVEFEERYL